MAEAAAQSVPTASAPLPAPQVLSTVPVPPTTQSITIQLPPKAPDEKYFGLEPAMWGPVVTGLALIVATAYQVWNTNTQLAEARKTADRQITEARAIAKTQIEEARSAAARQVESAREQARLDRTLESRKALFDTFIDDFKKTAALIGDLPSKDMTQAGPDIEELSSMNATVNKIWLWAEVSTVKEVRELQAQINEHFFQAMVQCQPIWVLRKRIGRIDTKLRQLEADREQYLAAARAFVPHPDPIQEQQQRTIADLLSFATASINQGRFERNIALAEHGKLRSAYLSFVGARSTELMDYLGQIMTLARKELQVDGDTVPLEAQTADFKKRVSAAIAQVQKALAEEAAKSA